MASQQTNNMLHYLPTTIKPLIGKKLQSITRTADNAATVEFQDGSKVSISVDGDCCSTSIFYSIEMSEDLIGATLEDVHEGGYDDESLSVKTADNEETALEKVKLSGIDFSPECNSVWNVVLQTNRGNALLRHINASNGYYDGYTTYKTL